MARMCKKCAGEINNNEKFCPFCGEPVSGAKKLSAVAVLAIVLAAVVVICSVVLVVWSKSRKEKQNKIEPISEFVTEKIIDAVREKSTKTTVTVEDDSNTDYTEIIKNNRLLKLYVDTEYHLLEDIVLWNEKNKKDTDEFLTVDDKILSELISKTGLEESELKYNYVGRYFDKESGRDYYLLKNTYGEIELIVSPDEKCTYRYSCDGKLFELEKIFYDGTNDKEADFIGNYESGKIFCSYHNLILNGRKNAEAIYDDKGKLIGGTISEEDGKSDMVCFDSEINKTEQSLLAQTVNEFLDKARVEYGFDAE